jgi:hypothetical protein
MEGRNIQLFRIYNNNLRYTAFLLTTFILTVLFPAFGVLPYFFSIYQDKYIWVVSALFLESKNAGIILFLLLFLFFLFTGLLFLTLWLPHLDLYQEKRQEKQNNKWSLTVFSFLGYFLLCLGNLIAMLLVDLGYVYVVINYDTVIITFTEICLSVVKVGWNNVVIWQLLKFLYTKISFVLSKIRCIENFKGMEAKEFPDTEVSIISFNIGLNNLIYPCFALIILSTNCFYNVFYPAPEITSSYSYPTTFNFIDEPINIESSSFAPPFKYSFECSSTIFAYYCPIFILMFLIESVLIPIWELPKLYKYSAQDINSSESCGPGNLMQKSANVQSEIELVERIPATSISNAQEPSPSFLKRQSGKISTVIQNNSILGEYSQETTARSIIFHKNHYIVKFNSYFLILIIYGSVFPVLAIIGLISIYIRTKYEELLFGHYLLLAKKTPYSSHQILFKLDMDCSNMFSSCHYTFFMIFFISIFVFSFLIFDTFGRQTPVAVAMVPTIIFFSSFLVMMITWTMWKQQRLRSQSAADQPSNIVEEVYPVENPITVVVPEVKSIPKE